MNTQNNSTDYKGIDYSHGLANIDYENKIRYGVIHQHAVGQAWYDDSEGYYGEYDFEDEEEEMELLNDFVEPISHIVDDGEYQAEASVDSGDIFITKSPYFTYAQFCSPCAPGACHLENPLDHASDENKCYCFGHDWFESGIAPYDVYSVETGKKVLPDNS